MRNAYTQQGDTVQIHLPSRRYGNHHTALIDAADLPSVRRLERWDVVERDGAFYCVGKFPRRPKGELELAVHPTLDLHTAIAGPPRGFTVAFANGNTLDCRRDNLRLVTSTKANTLISTRKPRSVSWMPNVSSIIATLSAMDCERLSACATANVFGVGRDQAHYAIRLLGGEKDGGRLYLNRQQALRSLQAIAQGGDYQRGQNRIRRVTGEMARAAAILKAKSVTFAAPTTEQVAQITDTVDLCANELRVRFTDLEDLMRQLMALAIRAAKDPDNFIPKEEAS